MCVLPGYVCTPCVQGLKRPREGIRSLWTGVTDCELPCGCWESSPGLWRATTAEPSLQPNVDILKPWSQLREFTVKRQLLSAMNSPLLHTCTHTHVCQLGCVILSVKHVLHSKLFHTPLSDGLGSSFSHVTPPPLEECLLPLEPRAPGEWSGLSSSLICSQVCVCAWVSHLPLGFVCFSLWDGVLIKLAWWCRVQHCC